MNANELYTLLNDLPDDYVTAAAGTHRQFRRPLSVIVPAVAACITLLLAAAVYPKLRTQKPERQDPAYTAETTAPPVTASAVTTALPEEQEPSAVTASQTVRTTASAAATQTQTVRTTAVTTKTQPVSQTAVTQKPAEQSEPNPVTTEHVRETEQKTPVEAEIVTTYNPYMEVTAAATEQTVPFSLRKGYRNAPDPQQGGTPETVPVPPETTAAVTRKTTAAVTRKTTEAATTALPQTGPVPATTSVLTAAEPEQPATTAPPPEEYEPQTTSAPPYYDEHAPVQAETERKASRWQITLTQNCQDAALTRGELSDGHLTLELTCLRGSPDGRTVVLLLTLPEEIHAQLADIAVQITETEDAAEFERIAGQAPVICNRTEKEDES